MEMLDRVRTWDVPEEVFVVRPTGEHECSRHTDRSGSSVDWATPSCDGHTGTVVGYGWPAQSGHASISAGTCSRSHDRCQRCAFHEVRRVPNVRITARYGTAPTGRPSPR